MLHPIDAPGRKCVIFVVEARYGAHYPQSAAVVDVLGHTTRVPFTHASFCCLHLSSGTSYAYTTLIHMASSAARGYWRTNTFHVADLLSKVSIYLGVKSGNIPVLEAPGAAALLKIGRSLKKRCKVQVDNKNSVVPCNFKTYITS